MRLSQLTLRVFALCAALFCNRAARADETVATSPAQDSGKVELRLRLQKGQVLDQVVDIAQKTSQTIQKKRYDESTTMRFNMHFEVLDVSPEGNARIRETYKRVQFSMDAALIGSDPTPANPALHYDSAKPPKTLPPAATGFAALVGQSLTVTMASDGQTVKVEGIEQLINHALAKTKLPASVLADLKKQLQAQFSDQAMKTLGSVSRYPEQAVGIGDKWQNNVPATAATPFALATEYSLLARKDNVARIGVVSKATPSTGTITKMVNVETKISMGGTQSGTLTVDEKTGWTRSGEIQQRFAGKITQSAKGQKSQSWPIYVSSTIRVSTTTPK